MKLQTILIVDPEEAVRESLHLVLSEEGYLCFSAKNESEAFRTLHDEGVQLLILDSQVLAMSKLLKKVKELRPQIKIILISSYAEVETALQALANGADTFVLKPLDFEELLAQVETLLLPAAG